MWKHQLGWSWFVAGGIGALLGFEGIRAVVWCVFLVGLLFENCIVDASIFFSCVVWPSYVGHMVDALAPGADEGRGRLR